MHSRKSKNSCPIAIEPTTKAVKPTPANARQQVVDRGQSDPAAARRHASSHAQAQSPSQGRTQQQLVQRKDGVRVSDVRISDVIDCDSTASIRDDPFFRPYQSPHSTRLATQSRLAHGVVKRNKDHSKHANLPQVNIFVLGSPRVGKSTFIEKALDLRGHAPSAMSSKKMSLDGIVYVVRLFEISIDDTTIKDDGDIMWPTLGGNEKLPPADGALVLYDVTDRGSIVEIPDILRALYKSGIAVLLVSCKGDNPPQLRQVTVDYSKQIRSRLHTVETYSTSANVPESQKRCISIILRSILKRRKAGSIATTSWNNTRSNTSISPANGSPHESSQLLDRVKTDKHAITETSISGFEGTLEPSSKGAREPSLSHKLAVDASAPHGTSSLPHRYQLQIPLADLNLLPDDSLSPPEDQGLDATSGPDSPPLTSILRPDTADSQAHNTFLIMEEESQDEYFREDHSPQTPRAEIPGRSEPARDETGSSFDELIDRLLALPMSKQDGKFVPVFLCLYRKFSTPSQVFSAITNRFFLVEQSNDAQLVKVGEQLRYLQVLASWTADYPGDFAQSSIKRDALAFVCKLEKSRVFAYAAKEISNHLELAVEDEDAEWGRLDVVGAPNDAEGSLHIHSAENSPSLRTGPSSTEELLNSSKSTSSEASYEDSTRKPGVPPGKSSNLHSSNISSQSLAALPTRGEILEEAQSLAFVPRTRLSKIQWHQFMEIPDEEIAKELTRMDWILYSSIRPRDLVRHVIFANDTRRQGKSLEQVHRMIDHFNHVFCFVSGMILLRDKPKHRARMLEKWMTIAWRVRQLNNYNTLGAIIAGTNGTAVHRLTSTWELVPEDTRKNYMRLTILMGTMRSHSAYRMAWENSFSERIPFIPVHRKDLLAAETGNRTFIGPRGDRINWKKFEIMGEVILSIQRSQDKPYKIPKREDIIRLVLETQISQTDEDLAEELYERSLQVEPTSFNDSSRKKFDWLRR